jgi:hypothetical protein
VTVIAIPRIGRSDLKDQVLNSGLGRGEFEVGSRKLEEGSRKREV